MRWHLIGIIPACLSKAQSGCLLSPSFWQFRMRALSWAFLFIFRVMTFQMWQVCVSSLGCVMGESENQELFPLETQVCLQLRKCLPMTVPRLCLLCLSRERRKVFLAWKSLPWTSKCLCRAALLPPVTPWPAVWHQQWPSFLPLG